MTRGEGEGEFLEVFFSLGPSSTYIVYVVCLSSISSSSWESEGLLGLNVLFPSIRNPILK